MIRSSHVCLAIALAEALPVENRARDHQGELMALVDLADQATGPQAENNPEDAEEAAAAAGESGNPDLLSFAGTLQHVANRFCTERERKYGNGAIFCNELVGLQHKWIDASSLGNIEPFTRLLGVMSGHFCPTQKATEDSRCLVLSLLTRAVPADLKWNADRKRYLQMTKDLGSHYCQLHGTEDDKLVCPLMQALHSHYFDAVMTRDDSKYVAYVNKLNDHYCKGEELNHGEDARCNIFPLVLQALPALPAKDLHEKVHENRHAHPDTRDHAENPSIDESMQYRADVVASDKALATATQKSKQTLAASVPLYTAREYKPEAEQKEEGGAGSIEQAPGA